MTRRTRPLVVLDLLRFGCALAVVFYHFFAGDPLDPGVHVQGVATSASSSLAPWTWWGWVGVELFFVISGYVIARSAVDASAADFLRRRALRLFPAAWLCASATFLVLLAGSGFDRGALAASWSRSMVLWPVGVPIDGSYWTLSVELAFYLFVAAILGRRGRPERIDAAGVALCLAGLVYGALGTYGSPEGPLRPLSLLFVHGGEFALGMALASRAARPAPAKLGWIALGLLGSMLEIAAHAAERGRYLGMAASPGLPWLVFLAGVVLIAAAPALQRRLTAAAALRHSAAVGVATYPLYLLHQDAGAVLAGIGTRAGLSWTAASLLAIGAVMLLAWWTARRGEPAIRRALASATALSSRGRARGTPPTASPPAC